MDLTQREVLATTYVRVCHGPNGANADAISPAVGISGNASSLLHSGVVIFPDFPLLALLRISRRHVGEAGGGGNQTSRKAKAEHQRARYG
jgi:hypothetical protein